LNPSVFCTIFRISKGYRAEGTEPNFLGGALGVHSEDLADNTKRLTPDCDSLNFSFIYSPFDTPEGLGRGYFLRGMQKIPMPSEPSFKTAIAFIDGQNLFGSAKEAFGYSYPNYDTHALALKICSLKGWRLVETCFYTGVPDAADNPFWNHFWAAKLAQMGRQNIRTFSRSLRYRNKSFSLPDGSQHSVMVGQEKGIDVRVALDIVGAAYNQLADVLLVFSQDQDLSEVADEIRAISKGQNRWLRIACAFPLSPTSKNRRGINGTEWIPIERALYDACLDARDYRPKGAR
jgi:uncharacterized LabA/DUF88 family protein